MNTSEEDNSDFLRCQTCLQAPIVQVVVQVPVSRTELQLLQELDIVHDVQCVENVEVVLLGLEKRIFHQGNWVIFCCHVEEQVR